MYHDCLALRLDSERQFSAHRIGPKPRSGVKPAARPEPFEPFRELAASTAALYYSVLKGSRVDSGCMLRAWTVVER
jgi:hypothetical protein